MERRKTVMKEKQRRAEGYKESDRRNDDVRYEQRTGEKAKKKRGKK